MTDEARRLYYSPKHWKKMLDAQQCYVSYLTHKYSYVSCSQWEKYRRLGAVLQSARARYKEFDHLYHVMSGHPCYMSARRHAKSLIVGDINYGLMLEGLRTKLHDDIDNKFERHFRITEMHLDIKECAKVVADIVKDAESNHALDAMAYVMDTVDYVQRIGRSKRPTSTAGRPIHFGVDFGKPGGDRSVLNIGYYERALRTRSIDEKDIPKS